MLKRFILFIILIVPGVLFGAGCPHHFRQPSVHVIRANGPALNPIAKHPVVPRRVASARRGGRIQNRRMP